MIDEKKMCDKIILIYLYLRNLLNIIKSGDTLNNNNFEFI